MQKPIDLYCMYFQDRSDRVRWLLEEMNIPYKNHFLVKENGDLNTKEYRSLNPMGRVPTIVDGDIILNESAAICMYLADTYSYGKLAPAFENTKLRSLYTQWMVFSVGSLEVVIARMFTSAQSKEEEALTHQYVKEQCEIFKLALNPILSTQEYILPHGFSTVDIMIGSIIPGAYDYLIKDNSPLLNYMERLTKRDAAIRAKVF